MIILMFNPLIHKINKILQKDYITISIYCIIFLLKSKVIKFYYLNIFKYKNLLDIFGDLA